MPSNTIKASPQVGGFQVRSSLSPLGFMSEVCGVKKNILDKDAMMKNKMCCIWAWEEMSVTRTA